MATELMDELTDVWMLIGIKLVGVSLFIFEIVCVSELDSLKLRGRSSYYIDFTI